MGRQGKHITRKKPWNLSLGGRDYTFTEFARLLSLLDARQNQYGYTVTNPAEMAMMEGNLGGQPFSFDPRSGQFVRNPSTTMEQRSMIGDVYGGVGGTGAPGQQSFMYLKGPGGNVPVPTSSAEVERFLGLPPETRKLIANMTPEEYGRLKLMGGGTPGVRDESGLTPPMEGPVPGQSLYEFVKEKRGEQRTGHKPVDLAAQRAERAALNAERATRGQLMEPVVAAMFAHGIGDPAEAYRRLQAKGLYNINNPQSLPVGDPYGNFGSEQDYFDAARWTYDQALRERTTSIAAQRLMPWERAQRLALKQMRAPSTGAFATGAMSSTWK